MGSYCTVLGLINRHQRGLIQMTLEQMIVHHPFAVRRNGTGQHLDIQGHQDHCFVDYLSLEFVFIRAPGNFALYRIPKKGCVYAT